MRKKFSRRRILRTQKPKVRFPYPLKTGREQVRDERKAMLRSKMQFFYKPYANKNYPEIQQHMNFSNRRPSQKLHLRGHSEQAKLSWYRLSRSILGSKIEREDGLMQKFESVQNPDTTIDSEYYLRQYLKISETSNRKFSNQNRVKISEDYNPINLPDPSKTTNHSQITNFHSSLIPKLELLSTIAGSSGAKTHYRENS